MDADTGLRLHGVTEFIERAASIRPILLVFEDLHWADESTVLLLRHMSTLLRTMRVMVIGTYRDDELEPDRPLTAAIGSLVRDGGAVDLHPGLLGRDEVAAVLAARAGQDPPAELVDLVVTETQGNPFFVEELFRHLRASGRLFDDDGRWRPDVRVGETEVPQTVRLLITQRLNQLDPEHRKALASAAVIGRSFDFGELAAVARQDEDELLDALEAAARAHLVEEDGDDHDARYVFVHEQIRQTLVGELSIARRQRVHLRAADAIVDGGRGSSVDLAHHLLCAGQAAPPERTVAALVAAARANIASLAFEDALRHLDNASRLVDDADELELCRMRADALRGAGRVDDALAVLDEQLARAQDPVDATALRLQRIQLLNDQYRAAEGLDDIDALLATVDETDEPELELAVQLARGRAHYILSLDEPVHARTAREAYEAAYEVAREHGDRASMARALLPTTWFTDYWADYAPIAFANVDEALRLAEEVGDEDLLLDAQSAAMHRGGLGVGTDAAEELLARLEARRDPVKLNAHCFWMMWQYHAAGRFERSIAMCDRGLELSDLIGSAPVQYGSIKAIALAEMGRFDEVAAAIDQEVTDDDHPFGQAMASLARSVLLARLSAWGPAAESLSETLARAEALSRVWMQNWARSLAAITAANLRAAGGDGAPTGLVPDTEVDPRFHGMLHGHTGAEVALTEGRPADAIELAGRAADRAQPSQQQARALDVVARAHFDLGDLAAAAATAERGLALAVPMQFGTIVWRLRMVRSLALGEPTDQAAAEFRALADRIADPDLRWWFERQPLAPR